MTIHPIVEGFGEVSAVPILLRRLLAEAAVYNAHVGKPIRRTRSQLVQEELLRASVRLALLRDNCNAILIMFDADDDCPVELVSSVQRWAQAEAGDVPCEVVIANREYEAWFLAAIESLRGQRGILPDAESHPDPEAPRDAKGRLEDRMRPSSSYSETTDQAALTALFDMSTAYARCRSFRRMAHAFGVVVAGAGAQLAAWPPAAWEAGC